MVEDTGDEDASRARATAVAARGASRVGPDGVGASAEVLVAVEEPLEIHVAGERIAVTMRTPGEDHALVVGFLFAEGVIAGRADLGTVTHCGRVGDPARANTIDVLPGPGTALDVERSRRGTLTSAACGVCGREGIEDLVARMGRLPVGRPLALALLRASTGLLADAQRHFRSTGGLHAALVLDRARRALAFAEDVGRHNAVDKVVGRLVLDGTIPAVDGAADAPALLVVSGRVSFEIVQKAVAARISAVAAVSAPTSLAIDLARASGVTLAGFVREGSLLLYAHPERVVEEGA